VDQPAILALCLARAKAAKQMKWRVLPRVERLVGTGGMSR